MEDLLYVTPKQPFFVTGSKEFQVYFYNKFGIVQFYQYITSDKPFYAIPDGSCDMLFCCDPYHPYAIIYGTVFSLDFFECKPNTLFFGVRFLPGFNPCIGQEGILTEIVNKKIDFNELIHDDKMLDGIYRNRDFKVQISYFMNSYLSIYRRINPPEYGNLIVRHSVNSIFKSGGQTSVEEIAEDTGYSVRYINECVRNETGLSPKQLAKFIRFQSAVSALDEINNKSLTEIGANLGYFDQAHFTHDFKSFTGLTPKKYQKFIIEEKLNQRMQIITN